MLRPAPTDNRLSQTVDHFSGSRQSSEIGEVGSGPRRRDVAARNKRSKDLLDP